MPSSLTGEETADDGSKDCGTLDAILFRLDPDVRRSYGGA